MRNPLDNTYDFILNLFTSFGYFDNLDDNLKVLNSIHDALNPDGIVVIDFMNASKVINSLVKSEVKTIDGIEFSITRRYDGTHIFKDIRFSDNGTDYHYTERVQALKIGDFEHLLALSGFNILHTFGNFDLESFNEQNSDRLILIAQRA
jgi:SAM-dependent methyltransferase